MCEAHELKSGENSAHTHTHMRVVALSHICAGILHICLCMCCVPGHLVVFIWISEGWLMDIKHLQGEHENGVLLGLSPQETPAKTSK